LATSKSFPPKRLMEMYMYTSLAVTVFIILLLFVVLADEAKHEEGDGGECQQDDLEPVLVPDHDRGSPAYDQKNYVHDHVGQVELFQLKTSWFKPVRAGRVSTVCIIPTNTIIVNIFLQIFTV
jgi:hypothetical protein